MRAWNGVVALALLATALVGASCGGSGAPQNSTAQPSTVTQLRDAAVVAMNGLQSYRAELDIGASPPYIEEFQRPANYRTLLGIKDFATGANQGVAEGLYVGDSIFARHCVAVETNCGAWQEQPRGREVAVGPSPTYFPQWPFVALEQADELGFVSQENIAGSSATHVRGSVKLLRAIFENDRRLVTAMGGSSFGMKCSASSTTPVRFDASATPSSGAFPTDSCRALTFEEELANQPALPYSDLHPATVDFWIDDTTHLVHRVEVTEPQQDGPSTKMIISYSMFNGVKIEAPAQSTALPTNAP